MMKAPCPIFTLELLYHPLVSTQRTWEHTKGLQVFHDTLYGVVYYWSFKQAFEGMSKNDYVNLLNI